ncbi:MAG: hypothetical protein ACJ79G_00600, partial [Myxococcales bacterium]
MIPVDDDEAVFDGDDEGDVTVKGGVGLGINNAPTGRLRAQLIRAARAGQLATGRANTGIQSRGESSSRAVAGNV